MKEIGTQRILFWVPTCEACGILVPLPVSEPGPSALRMKSLNHWTTREFRKGFHFKGTCAQFSPQQTCTLSSDLYHPQSLSLILYHQSLSPINLIPQISQFHPFLPLHILSHYLSWVNPTLFTCYYRQWIPYLQVGPLQDRPQGILYW